VKSLILDHAFATLPDPPFTDLDKEAAADRLFQHVWHLSAGGGFRSRRGCLIQAGQEAYPTCYNLLVFPVTTQGIIMPKLKTHKGAAKRFKKTGTGLVVRGHAFGRHILTSKPHKRKKKLHKTVVADKADQPVLKRMLPY